MNFMKDAARGISLLAKIQSCPVLVSANKNIYVNLALEHWLYNNLRFAGSQHKDLPDEAVLHTPMVLIWTDEPCVVIGRHQNPWTESCLGIVDRARLPLARRHSGGGCVYHDENNINISIIGDRKHFEKRQENLKFLAGLLGRKYGITCETTPRHDIVHRETGYKVTGSAAKLGRFNSYHHFTLLVDTNKDNLNTVIRQEQQDFIRTNSSLSKRSTVINLKEMRTDLSTEQVMSDLVNEYGSLYGNTKKVAEKQEKCYFADYSGLEDFAKYKQELESWDWIYGKTPKFTLNRKFSVLDRQQAKNLEITVQVDKGLFESIVVEGDLQTGSNQKSSIFEYLVGGKFTYREAMTNVAKLLQVSEAGSQGEDMSNIGVNQLCATYLLHMIHECNF